MDDTTLYSSPTPILSELLLETDPTSEARRIFGLGHRSDFRASQAPGRPVLSRRQAPTHPFRRDDATAVVGDPAAEGPDTSTITLPAVAERLRAFASARFAHQPLGPGAPTVVIPPAEG